MVLDHDDPQFGPCDRAEGDLVLLAAGYRFEPASDGTRTAIHPSGHRFDGIEPACACTHDHLPARVLEGVTG